MISAYAKTYLAHARTNLANMLDYAVNDLGYSLKDFWTLFLESQVSREIENGNPTYLTGKSGKELAYLVLNVNDLEDSIELSFDRSPYYWLGWALAYYQWSTSYSFKYINDNIDILRILDMYNPYHEMDIRQFVDKMNEMIKMNNGMTRLKMMRLKKGLSQSELANESGVPLRMIQHYEQGEKNINAAKAETVIAIADSLNCSIKDILERK